jgi:hypothetical protein
MVLLIFFVVLGLLIPAAGYLDNKSKSSAWLYVSKSDQPKFIDWIRGKEGAGL